VAERGKKKRAKKKAPPAPEVQAQLTPPATESRREVIQAYTLLALSAVLMFLGFAGFGVWPLAFCGMIPALWVLDREPRPMRWKFFRRALFFGYVAYCGGFYWVVTTIADFGGFPLPLAVLFASVYFLYQASEYVLILWLWRRARDRGWNATISLVSAYVAVELAFPMVFDHYYGNSFHMLPLLIQVADIGGPLLLTALAMLGNGALYEIAKSRLEKTRLPRAAPLAFVAALAIYLGYGLYRTHEVETRAAQAARIDVGIVQSNMGIWDWRRDRLMGRARHIEQSLELEERHHPDLIVWPESSAYRGVLESQNVQTLLFTSRDGRQITTPVLFGGSDVRQSSNGEWQDFNTAFMTDGSGNITATYDKIYLLAFGEYLPFGDFFPVLYEWSPNTGHSYRGEHVRALPFRDYRISTLICYEDILPGFVRRVVSENDPHRLVNITNDAWFGDTHEPHVHLVLAKFRAVEHHRYLVRATLTGVSAIVDPLGRVVTQSPVNQRASLHGEVAMMSGWTPYQTLGDWPGWLALGAILFLAFVGRRKKREDVAPTPASH
jgi:apolipoprotein N-acyltransferase